MTDSRNFDLKNYRRLEKFNNWVNVASTILFLLALISLPVTFFSLDATRSDDVVFSASTKPVEIDTLSYFVYFTPHIIFPNQSLIFGEALKSQKWQLTFGLWREETEYDSEIQRTVEIDASLPVAIRMQFGTNPLDSSVQQLLVEYDAVCNERHRFLDNATDTIRLMSLCFPHVPDLDSYRIMIKTNSTQRYKRFFSGYLSSDLSFKHPRTVLTSTLPCEGAICFQSFSASKNIHLSHFS
jgi:hypothetical protein